MLAELPIGKLKEHSGLVAMGKLRTMDAIFPDFLGQRLLRMPTETEPGKEIDLTSGRHVSPVPDVRISGPSSVTRTVCSNCALRFPSAVTAVQ